MIFILDSVKDTDFYKKNRVSRTTDSRLVELATKLQSLDSLALFYFSSLLLLIIAIHLTFVFVRWFKKRVDVFRKTRYDIINYRLVKVTTKSDDDGKKGEVDNSPLRAFQELFQPTPEKERIEGARISEERYDKDENTVDAAAAEYGRNEERGKEIAVAKTEFRERQERGKGRRTKTKLAVFVPEQFVSGTELRRVCDQCRQDVHHRIDERPNKEEKREES